MLGLKEDSSGSTVTKKFRIPRDQASAYPLSVFSREAYQERVIYCKVIAAQNELILGLPE